MSYKCPTSEEISNMSDAELEAAYEAQEAADVKQFEENEEPKIEKSSMHKVPTVEDIAKMAPEELQKAYEAQEAYYELKKAQDVLMAKIQIIDDEYEKVMKDINVRKYEVKMMEEKVSKLQKALTVKKELKKGIIVQLPRR